MNRIGRFFRRLRYLLRLRSESAELAEELAFHEAMSSRRAMGNVTLMREEARAVWVRPWLESAMQDAAYALRGLWRQPGFSIVAIATLGLAIGLNTTVFTAFNSVYWRQWPVADPARVFQVMTLRDGRERYSDFTLVEYETLARRTRSLSGLVGMACTDGFSPGCDVWLDDVVSRPAYVSANAFHVLGIPLERGHAFAADDDRVVVLSDVVWRRQYGADSAIVGRQVHLDGIPFTVIGVGAADFGGTSLIRTDLWLPLAALPLVRARDAASQLAHLQLAARVARDASPGEARAELDATLSGLRADKIGRGHGPTRVRLATTSLDPNPVKRRTGYAVFGLMLLGSALVILLACANLANLYLARAAARGREIAVRISLGASRLRVIRQLLTENLVLASVATAVGIGISFVAPSYLLRLIAADSISVTPVPNLMVLGYAAGLTVMTCLAFGLAPALHATATSIGDALKGRYGLAGVNLSLRHALLAVQVAVSVVVLCGAGFLMRGLGRAVRQDFGFNVPSVSAIVVELPGSQDSARAAIFARDLVDGIRRRPDAQRIAATTNIPFGGRNQTLVLQPGQDSASARSIFTLEASGEYFSVLGIPLVSGRVFTNGEGDRRAILVNQAAAARLWSGQNPLGQSLTIGTVREVVGVVRDADTEGVASVEGSALPKIYEPLGARGSGVVPSFLVRDASPQALHDIAELARRLAPTVHVTTVPLVESLDRKLDEIRHNAQLVALLGGVSLVLVSIGIFGVFAYVVQQRTREIGVRMALGARNADIIRVIVGSTVRPILIGLIVGLAGAVGESFVVRGFIYGLSPFDPVTYAMIVAILGIASLAAVYLPARRASRIVPIVALRVE